MGGTSVSEAHISSITDSIILLRYVEIFGEMRRGLAVLKMRGSMHQKEIREFTIDDKGMHIGPAFRNVSGILSGRAVHATSDELGRLDEMFQDGPSGRPSADREPIDARRPPIAAAPCRSAARRVRCLAHAAARRRTEARREAGRRVLPTARAGIPLIIEAIP